MRGRQNARDRREFRCGTVKFDRVNTEPVRVGEMSARGEGRSTTVARIPARGRRPAMLATRSRREDDVQQGYFLAIAGNIGVGKTELTLRLSEELGWPAYFEPVIQNPYL